MVRTIVASVELSKVRILMSLISSWGVVAHGSCQLNTDGGAMGDRQS